MAHKLLVLDVDGTLIGDGAYPSPRTTEAIAAAREKGVTVALGTGRATEACYHILRHLRLSGLSIFFDGAAVVDWPSNDMIVMHALPPHAARLLVELARQYDMFLEIYAHDFYFIEKDGPLADNQREKLQLNPLITDLMSLVDRIKIVKGQLLASNEEEEARAALIIEEMSQHCKMSRSLDPSNNIYFINAIARNVSKGNALREMVDYLGISLDDVIAVGDSFNDLPVFEVAGTSVAMGNAPDSLKAKADWVAPSVYEDGVAAVIEKYIL